MRGWDTLVGARRDKRPGVGLGRVCLHGRLTHQLGAVVGDNDADMRLICHEVLTEAFLLGGESLGREARKRLRTK